MAKLIELFGRLDARQISSVCEEIGSHVTIASTEPQHRRLWETNDQQDSLGFARELTI